MPEKLVTVTSHRCAGLERDDDGLYQIETREGTEAAHDIAVQHFNDGTTRVLCAQFSGDCHAVYRKGKNDDLKLEGGTAMCPFKKGPIGESK